jgi:hypothetical protein
MPPHHPPLPPRLCWPAGDDSDTYLDSHPITLDDRDASFTSATTPGVHYAPIDSPLLVRKQMALTPRSSRASNASDQSPRVKHLPQLSGERARRPGRLAGTGQPARERAHAGYPP